MKIPIEERFWQKTDQSGGAAACWPWTGEHNSGGYGRAFLHRDAQRRHVKKFAHRIAFELAVGSIPDGMAICHRCDNPPCCNPAHLFLGTLEDNARDRAQKARSAVGARLPQTKLTPDQVRGIREMHASGAMQRQIASTFGIGQATVSDILTGTTWRHLNSQ